MINWHQGILGHERALDFLNQSIVSSKIAHAYLFTGPRHSGKKTVAAAFSNFLVGAVRNSKTCSELAVPFDCNTHPDIIILDPLSAERVDKKEAISVAHARQFTERLNQSSFLGGRKVGIVREADELTLSAANALLKTLEEPTASSVLILCAHNLEKILPTIRSRAEIIRFAPVAIQKIENFLIQNGIERKAAADNALASSGLPGLALRFSFDEEVRNERVEALRQLQALEKTTLSGRLKKVEEICAAAGKASDAEETLLRVLFFWESEARRALLASCGAVSSAGSGENNYFLNDFGKAESVIKAIDKARAFIYTHVDKRLALEQIALAF